MGETSTTVSGEVAGLTEVVQVFEQLPPDRRRQLADFASFLLERTQREGATDEDEAWEATLSKPGGHPKLEAFADRAVVKGRKPLDLDRL